jgi:hypothetical protein
MKKIKKSKTPKMSKKQIQQIIDPSGFFAQIAEKIKREVYFAKLDDILEDNKNNNLVIDLIKPNDYFYYAKTNTIYSLYGKWVNRTDLFGNVWNYKFILENKENLHYKLLSLEQFIEAINSNELIHLPQ